METEHEEKVMELENPPTQPQTENQNIVTNALTLSLTDESTATAVRNLVSDLSAQLETLRRIAQQKEKYYFWRKKKKSRLAKRKRAAARQAKADVVQVENQLRALLLSPPASGQLSQLPHAYVVPITTESSPGPSTSNIYSWAERGRCKFRCFSSTHEFASDCDVYSTITDRTDRMRAIRLCFRCFQYKNEPDHESRCHRVPCYYCSQNNRLSQVEFHVSVLCPFMFPQ